MRILVAGPRRNARFEELWLGWHGAAQALAAVLASVEGTAGAPRVPAPRGPSSAAPSPRLPSPATPARDIEVTLHQMLSHQRRLGDRVRALQEAGHQVPGCQSTLAEMVTTLARLRLELAREG